MIYRYRIILRPLLILLHNWHILYYLRLHYLHWRTTLYHMHALIRLSMMILIILVNLWVHMMLCIIRVIYWLLILHMYLITVLNLYWLL
mmetsp:Transcript_1952/g.190  ORF Transcript_1952/g.190 Transcript_1952/m.190 type:complete len:89 (-) Transcript_1952:145-411(-)